MPRGCGKGHARVPTDAGMLHRKQLGNHGKHANVHMNSKAHRQVMVKCFAHQPRGRMLM